MRLSEIISGMNLSTFPQVAMVIFLLVFVAVVVRALMAKPDEMKRAAGMVFDDDSESTSEPAQKLGLDQ